MYDAVDAAAVPAGAPIVAGYVDGRYASFDALVAKFPQALHVSITTGTDFGALVCDREAGNANEAEAARWAHARVAIDLPAVIYMSLSDENAVATQLDALGMSFADPSHWPAEEVYAWDADWTGVAHLDQGSIGTQFISLPGYDLSDVGYGFPFLSPRGPQVPPVPLTLPGVAMKIIKDATGPAQYVWTEAGKIPLGPAESADLPALYALCGQSGPASLSPAMIAAIPTLT